MIFIQTGGIIAGLFDMRLLYGARRITKADGVLALKFERELA